MGTNESAKEQLAQAQGVPDGRNAQPSSIGTGSVQSGSSQEDRIENEYFEQYKMKEQGLQSLKAWSNFYETEDLLDIYLEKQGYSFEEHPELFEENSENEYFEQYKMKEQGSYSLKAWSDFYETEDLLDAYLEKQGYM